MNRATSFSIVVGVVACTATAVVAWLASSVSRNQCECEFAEAVGSEDYATVARLLRHGTSPNVDVFRFASDVGCSNQAWTLTFNRPKPLRWPALVYTLRSDIAHGDVGNTKMARLLLEASADPNASDELGNTPLIIASWYGNAEAVRLLLARNANRSAINNEGQTALDVARRNRHREIVSLLSAGRP
jgi:hypothetical protein